MDHGALRILYILYFKVLHGVSTDLRLARLCRSSRQQFYHTAARKREHNLRRMSTAGDEEEPRLSVPWTRRVPQGDPVERAADARLSREVGPQDTTR